MSDEPTLGEIGRGVTDLKAEIRLLRGELVRADVYAADRRVDDVRITAVEAGLKQIQDAAIATRRLVYGALITAFAGAALQIAVALAVRK